MSKQEYIRLLSSLIGSVKHAEKARYLQFYEEMIDDKIESGMTEQEAVASMGDVKTVSAEILEDAKERGVLKPERSLGTIILLVLGSPIWISLAAAGLAVAFAFYLVVWTLVFCLYTIVVSLAVVGVASVIYLLMNVSVNAPAAFFAFGSGLVCSALALALISPVIRLTKSIVNFTKNLTLKILNKFTTKGSGLL